ncbi:hypothetical protein KFE94_10720 [bacterium SCSIO 12643]|nr:hypothetical protein KFE94_10720 [bacterium SCSIO 12643]
MLKSIDIYFKLITSGIGETVLERKMNFKGKEYYILLFALCSSFIVFAQSNGIDKRIVDMYGPTMVAQMETEQPQTLAYLNYYIQYGYKIITDLPQEKVSNFPDISSLKFKQSQKTVTIEDIENLNILMLDIIREHDQFLTYRIGDTGKVIVFIAPDQVLSGYLLTQENK